MARAIDQSTKQTYSLVEFLVNGTAYRFTNWGTTIDPSGDNWLSLPEMEVIWPNNVGTLDDQPGSIRVSESSSATMRAMIEILLENGAPAPIVEVTIREVIRSTTAGVETSTLTPFTGYVRKAKKNDQGRGGMVRFEISTEKGSLDVALGLPCGHHCIWALFGRGCSVQGGAGERGPQLAVEQRTNLAVLVINGKTITVDADPGIDANKSFQYGYVERNGVRIGVQKWTDDTPTVFVLRQQPPDSWLNTFITAVPGCKKTIESCRYEWDNEDNFGGIGYAIPAYNPSFEDMP